MEEKKRILCAKVEGWMAITPVDFEDENEKEDEEEV
jgi:hypothetical protein